MEGKRQVRAAKCSAPDTALLCLFYWICWWWWWLIKLYRLQVYNSIICILYYILCSPRQVKSLFITIYSPYTLFYFSQPPFFIPYLSSLGSSCLWIMLSVLSWIVYMKWIDLFHSHKQPWVVGTIYHYPRDEETGAHKYGVICLSSYS